MPEEIVKKYGADILRLWVASSDYHSDIRISEGILGQLSDAYKKIRNTARYILGNLGNGDGFHPDRDSVSDDQLLELDRWALMRLDNVIQKAHEAMKHLISTSYSTQSITTAPLICPISIWTSSRIVCTANRKIPWLVVQHRPRFIGF